MPCIQRLASGLMYKASEALLGLRICGLLTKRLINGYGSLDIDHVFSICVCVCVCVYEPRRSRGTYSFNSWKKNEANNQAILTE